MKEMERKFELTKEQIEFLKKMYPGNLLGAENNGYLSEVVKLLKK